MKIGDRMWGREYLKWVEYEVIGETSRSWLLRRPGWDWTTPDKAPKKRRLGESYGWYTDDERAVAEWFFKNRYSVGNFYLSAVQDADAMREIFAVIQKHGFLREVPPPPEGGAK